MSAMQTPEATPGTAYLHRVEAAHLAEPLRSIPLVLARTAAALPAAVTAHPTSAQGIAAFKTAARTAGLPEPTRGEVKDAVAYLRRRGLAAPWWRCDGVPVVRIAREGVAR